jgi:hypothetical protein
MSISSPETVSRLDVIEQRVGESLQLYDAKMKEIEPGWKSLEELWGALSNERHTMEILRMNAMQFQVLFQEVRDEMMKNQLRRAGEFEKLKDIGDEAAADVYVKLQESMRRERSGDIRIMERLGRLIMNMTKTHNDAMLNKSQMVRLADVHRVLLGIRAVIHRHIQDADTLKKVETELSATLAALLPEPERIR